jgi:hypothetical protein
MSWRLQPNGWFADGFTQLGPDPSITLYCDGQYRADLSRAGLELFRGLVPRDQIEALFRMWDEFETARADNAGNP